MISIEIKSNITLREFNDSVFTAGVGYKIYRLFGIPIYKKVFNELLTPENEVEKEKIGFTKTTKK